MSKALWFKVTKYRLNASFFLAFDAKPPFS